MNAEDLVFSEQEEKDFNFLKKQLEEKCNNLKLKRDYVINFYNAKYHKQVDLNTTRSLLALNVGFEPVNFEKELLKIEEFSESELKELIDKLDNTLLHELFLKDNTLILYDSLLDYEFYTSIGKYIKNRCAFEFEENPFEK